MKPIIFQMKIKVGKNKVRLKIWVFVDRKN